MMLMRFSVTIKTTEKIIKEIYGNQFTLKEHYPVVGMDIQKETVVLIDNSGEPRSVPFIHVRIAHTFDYEGHIQETLENIENTMDSIESSFQSIIENGIRVKVTGDG